MDREDFKAEVRGWFSERAAKAIMRVNGTCWCIQCETKCVEVLEAFKEVQEKEAQQAYENGAH